MKRLSVRYLLCVLLLPACNKEPNQYYHNLGVTCYQHADSYAAFAGFMPFTQTMQATRLAKRESITFNGRPAASIQNSPYGWTAKGRPDARLQRNTND